MNRFLLLGFAALGAASGLTAAGTVHEITLPPETVFLQPSAMPGYSYAVGTCSICHSADYIRAQPKSLGWKAEVLKMKKVYGAPVVDAQADALADYLTQTYGSHPASPLPAAAPPAPHP